MKTLLLLVLIFIECFGYEMVIGTTEKIELANRTLLSRDDREMVVTDSNTHLMWQDNSTAKSVKKNWYAAQTYCKKLSLGGYEDWVLPTISQLESIADFSRFTPAIKKEFKNVDSMFYWSSTPYTDNPEIDENSEEVQRSYSNRINNEKIHETNAWSVNFMYGASINQNRKSSNRNVRCVRLVKLI